VLDYLPEEDIPWVIEELFGHASRFVYVTLADYPRTSTLPDGTCLRNHLRDLSWWQAHFAAASARYPEIHWTLVLHARTALGKRIALSREGGRCLGGPPAVWILTSHKPGHTTQSVGLAQALGWPYTVKELRFTALANVHRRVFGAKGATLTGLDTAHSAPLAPPWPDLVIATGWRPARVARWICSQTHGRARLVLLGRKGGLITGTSDIVVACPHFRLPPHPRRIETLVPLTHITPERLAQAAERWRHLFDNAPHPRIALLVGGSTARYQLDVETARRMGERVRTFAEEVGGKVFATTSRRTEPEAAEALLQGLGPANYVYLWHLNQKENPYLAYLALADVLIVTGESESMLAEAATTDKPVYIYPLPERPPGIGVRLKEWVVARSQMSHLKERGTARPQQGLEYLCARLIERGLIQPRRDLKLLHQALVHRSGARFFGEPLQTENRLMLRESDAVADKVRALLGLSAG
jgi:uncharacterized protein